METGQLQVWWVPQVPMTAFEVNVGSVQEGAKLLDVLAEYDLFQYENKVKPDYCNAGGLRRWCADSDGEGTPGWEDWCDEETGEDDPRAYVSANTEVNARGAAASHVERPVGREGWE